MPIQVLLIDDHEVVRRGLRDLLTDEPDIEVVAEALGVDEALAVAMHVEPDVAVVDVRLGDGDGISLCRRLKAAGELPRVILYTALPDDEVELLARIAGADGIVDKAAAPADLFEAIRLVARGETALPTLTREQLDAAAHRVEPDDLALLAMLVDRTPAADVAATLHMDHRRVAKRTERVLGRLRGGRTAPRAAV